jgi:death-on-curing protein
MPGYIYPTVAEALEIHKELIREFGGSQEVRDRGRLEAAIFRPQIGYYDDIVDEATALMESLANNHAFVDGNKRVSFAITDVFLRLNGSYLEVDPRAADDFITNAMQRGEFRFGTIRDWLRACARQLPTE